MKFEQFGWLAKSARGRARVLGAVALLVVAAVSACAQQQTPREEQLDPFYLDTYATSGTPTATGPILAAGVRYVVTVQGTHSSWGAEEWDSGACTGEPKDAPMFPSPGTTNSMVGMDAVWVFAVPVGSSRCGNTLPYRGASVRISLNGGAFFIDLGTATAGDGPTADHKYEYTVTGEGKALMLNRGSGNPTNNYGRLYIEVERAAVQ